MPVNTLSERDHLTIELALIIEDPAGVEQLDLAAFILELFANPLGSAMRAHEGKPVALGSTVAAQLPRN